MQEFQDIELLRQSARENSDEAFAALVSRHVNMVYSAALRKTGNPAAAKEITQAVFVILAQKANGLLRHTALSGWLYQATRLTAANFLRTEIRRARREQEAYMQSLPNQTEPEVWPQIMPLLEDAMGRLGEKDRDTLALRFFEGKSFQEIGTAFGVSENAARKRTDHALEKLRTYFSKRGVTSATETIAGVISANSVQAAPAALAKAVTAVAISKGVAASASTLTLIKGALKIMAWTKMKTTIVVSACVLLTAGTTTVILCNRDKPVHIQGIPKDWSILSGNSDQWNWANNTINGQSTNGDSILASTRQYGDVSVSAMVSTTNKEATLVLRMQDADNGYLAVFAPDGTPVTKADRDTAKFSHQEKSRGGKGTGHFKRRKLSAPGQLEKFTFTAKGTHLEVSLNDIPILKTNDTTFIAGFIGLRVYGWGDFPCDGVFSNLTVR